MSISEQVKELRYCANRWKNFENVYSSEPFKLLSEAADTIEALSAKLASANMERSELYYNDGWIPVIERLPEEKINPITRDFYEYQVTFQSEDVKDVRHYKFGKGHWWNGPGIMDKYVTAWRVSLKPFSGRE